MTKLISSFEQEGLVICKKIGRVKLISLTFSGNEIAQHLNIIHSLIKEIENNQ